MEKRLDRFRLFFFCFVITLSLNAVCAFAENSGTCGASAAWVLDDAGTLTISGTGPMYNYGDPDTEDSTPWAYEGARGDIRKVIVESGITYIGNNAFASFKTDDFNIADTVARVGEYAFYGCAELKQFPLGGQVTSIGAGAFQSCTGLSQLTIPGSVVNIGDRAFIGCSGLEKLTISDGVISIGASAFASCEKLTEAVIPGSVTSVGEGAFAACTSLVKYSISGASAHFSSDNGVLFDKEGTTLIAYPTGKTGTYVIPETVAYVKPRAFDSDGLTGLVIPSEWESIGDSWFAGCRGLQEIIIPKSVKKIGDYAFSGCDALNKVTLSEGLLSIGERAFSSCDALSEITIPKSVVTIGNSAFYADSEDRYYFYINGYRGTAAEAFAKGMKNCTFTALDAKVPEKPKKGLAKTIGKLKYKVTSVSGSGGTVTVTGPKSKTDKKLTIPATVTIGETKLKVTAISKNAFKGMKTLVTVKIGKNVATIGSNAFLNCKKLSSVTLGSAVKTIGAASFKGCEKLSAISLPKTVETIGKHAFYGDKMLKTVKILSGKLKLKQVGANAFYKIHAKATVLVPKKKVKAYTTLLKKKGIGKNVKVKAM